MASPWGATPSSASLTDVASTTLTPPLRQTLSSPRSRRRAGQAPGAFSRANTPTPSTWSALMALSTWLARSRSPCCALARFPTASETRSSGGSSSARPRPCRQRSLCRPAHPVSFFTQPRWGCRPPGWRPRPSPRFRRLSLRPPARCQSARRGLLCRASSRRRSCATRPIEWREAYFSPICYLTAVSDTTCIHHKIRDGRFWWGVARVVRCLCAPSAKILVEQPLNYAEEAVGVPASQEVDPRDYDDFVKRT
jgi:hypothetical protein